MIEYFSIKQGSVFFCQAKCVDDSRSNLFLANFTWKGRFKSVVFLLFSLFSLMLKKNPEGHWYVQEWIRLWILRELLHFAVGSNQHRQQRNPSGIVGGFTFQ